MASLLGKLKKQDEKKPASAESVLPDQKVTEKKPAETKLEEKKPVASQSVSVKTDKIKGVSDQSYRVLVKPLVTEKAAEMGAHGKYAFVVNPTMNKIEIKKAIRSVYHVDPVNVRIINVLGKSVRYGRSLGRRKDWKKAIVTLKPGDKIEIYEGV
ncbi:MAG: 50S ribosomal protein L23 [Candidatus Buchananbacteria bacterium]|nr:50S ribosomal protein L23 [Candidatus Buchananbacteria bacterium]